MQVVEIADACHGFVGADLAALCREAGLHALNRRFASEDDGMHGAPLPPLACISHDTPVSWVVA